MKRLITIMMIGLIASSVSAAMWINIARKQKIDDSMLPNSVPMSTLTGEALWRSWGFELLTPEIQAQLDAEAAAEAARIAEEKRIADEAEAARISIEVAKAARLAVVSEWIKLDGSSRIATAQMPRIIGNSFNCGPKQWAANNWRGIYSWSQPEAGFRVTAYVPEDIDGMTCNMKIVSTVNLADEQAQQAAAQQAAYVADLTNNAKRYTLENAYLMLCDQVMQRTTHEKMAAESMAVAIITIKKQDAVVGAKLETAFGFVNQALSYYDSKWWDRVQYRDVPELVAGAQQMLGLMQ